MSKDRLNIIIPIYNPHAGWKNNFIDSLQILENELNKTDFLVILVNDGSTIPINNIEEIVNRFGYLKYYSYPVNMGKGHAIRYGIAISEADYYIYTDADFPFGYEIILQTYQLLKSSGTNIVIGTRDASYSRMLPFERRIVSVLLKEVNYFITGFRIRDTQAGLKGLDNKAKKILAGTKTNSFIFELEFLKKSLRQGLSYKMINVKIRPGIHFTDFRFQVILNEAVSFFKLIFKIGEKDTSDF
jgi:glycosyltransferase involved in cell wall biosynthesis